MSSNNVLVLCPHTDDEINCAGTISKYANVHVLAFSTGNSKTGATSKEFSRSMIRLGVSSYQLLSFETRYFYRDRQQILQVLCSENPDIVYCPPTWDIHQDHNTICQEAIRAFKHCSIYGYETWQNGVTGQDVNHYVVLEEKHIQLKADLAKCYESQLFRPYMTYEYFNSLARLRGLQIATQYAESFQTIRSIEK